MSLWDSMVQVELTSVEPAAILHRLNNMNIALQDIEYSGDFNVHFSIFRKDLPAVEKMISKQGDGFAVKKKHGLYWLCRSVFKRPIFTVGMILLLLLAAFLPNRIYIIRVEGNTSLSSQMILERAGECGIGFGTRRRIVRSEKMKNALLSALPELEWAGINTSGCVAVIRVREKEQENHSDGKMNAVSSIIAARDGIIVSGVVYSGNPLYKTGQAVKKGQTLVSGYTDYGLTIKATAADAEIFGQTIRTLKLVTPVTAQIREQQVSTVRKYSLLVGKKLINFYKDSGICDTSCVKIYKENYMTLPGGTKLPLAIVTEEWTYHEILPSDSAQTDSYEWLTSAAKDYLLEQMISGRIFDSTCSFTVTGEICCMEGRYSCLEMIGQVKNEENIYGYGEYDGTNR